MREAILQTTLRALLGMFYIGSIRHKGRSIRGASRDHRAESVGAVNRQLQIRGRSQAGRLHRRRKPLPAALYCGQCGAAMV
jgi:hypothetical protein